MFTGIVTDVGVIERIEPLDHGIGLRVRTAWHLDDLAIGASVAHAGVCLTVVEKGSDWFETEAWEEALRLTTLGALKVGSRVNLERSLRIGDELGGHMVSGHVDGIARIRERVAEGGAVRFAIDAPHDLAPFIARKGSVALDGTSLTVNSVSGSGFDVLIIRHTLEVTTWDERQVGDAVNIEIDPMARYAARLMEFGKS
jgi:riboflavin synthase